MTEPENRSTPSPTTKQISVHRDPMNQTKFHETFQLAPNTDKLTRVTEKFRLGEPEQDSVKFCRVSRFKEKIRRLNILAAIFKLVPILSWLPKYKWKEDFVNDLMSGFTVGVMQVPQGLAYAMLANCDAISGIYTAFFPVIVYVILGTSRHVSMGTFAVVSILVSKPTIEYCSGDHVTNTTTSIMTSLNVTGDANVTGFVDVRCEMKVAMAVTFLSGIIQLSMGILKLGILSSLLSDSLMSGFTTGSAIHVLTSQVPHLLGYRIPKITGVGRLVKCYIEIFERIYNTNYVAIGITGVCLFILLAYELKLKAVIAKKCRFPIPIQLILVVIGTLAAWGLDLHASYGLRVVGNVPTGMPAPYVPFLDGDLLADVFPDSIGISVIAFVISLSISRIIANKHKYQVDANQELISQGAANIFGSFFQCLPIAGSLSRTMVQESTGGKTMIATTVSVIMLLFVILFIGPLFYHLPRAVLASIILVSLIGIFKQYQDFLRYARRSFSEAFVWMATFVSTVLLDVDLGLLVGLVVSLMFLVAWGYFPKIELIACTDYDDVFLQAGKFEKSSYGTEILAVRISGNLNMANSTSLSNRIENVISEHFPDTVEIYSKTKYLILDVSAVTHVDTAACRDIVDVRNHFQDRGLEIIFTGIRVEVWNHFMSCNVFEKISKDSFYPTIQDAFTSLNLQSSN